MALAGQAALSHKAAGPLSGLVAGSALYAFAAALLLVSLWRGDRLRRSDGGEAGGPSDEEPRATPRALPPGLEWSLVAVLVLGGLYLRVQRIDLIPWGLNNDEAIDAVEANEIAAGRPFSTFTERGLNRETMFHYLAALSYRKPDLILNILRAMPAVFGLQPKRISPDAVIMDLIFPLRAVSIACGALTILALYLFARWRFGWRVALLAALLLAVSPWHLLYSRVGYRTILAPLFAIAALAVFLRALESGRLRDHLGWGALVGLGLWTYTSFRAVPIALGAWLLLRHASARRRGEARPIPWRRVLAAAGAVAASGALLIAFAPLSLKGFLLRGAYATLPPQSHWGLNLFHALTMINHVPARYAVVQSNEFISDGVATTYGLIGLPPESPVTAALASLGILYAAWRGWRRGDAACALLVLAALALDLTVGLAGPSPTRLLQNLPWLCLCAALLAWRAFDDLAALRRPLTVWAAAAAILGLAGAACAQGYGQYFLKAGRSPEAMQNFGPVQTIMGLFVRSLPPGQEVYVLHTLRVDTLKYLIGDRPEVHLVTDPGSLDYDAIARLPRTVTFVVEYVRAFAEPMRLLVMRHPEGDMSQVADARLDPDKTIFFTFTLWKDENGQPMPPPGTPRQP